MKIGALVSNKELGRGLVMENTGGGFGPIAILSLGGQQ